MSGRVPKSGPMRSGILSRVFDDKDDEDPLEDMDLPDEYKKDKLREKEGDGGITIGHLHKLNTKNISAWNMKRLMKIMRHGSLSTLDEQILSVATEDESTTHIRSEYEAKAAARKIFANVAHHGSKYIYLQDLMCFLEKDQASKTMSFFEKASETSIIGKSSLKNWVVIAFRERRALALTLNDTKTVVNKLHQMINVIVGIIIVVISLVILGIAKINFFVLLVSQFLVVSFIFGNTAKTLFESIIFLFVIHPFDVGDRCEIDGVQLIVEEMNILTTLFLRAHDYQKVLYHNSVLATKSIEVGDSVEFHESCHGRLG
ncbi:mechanosensitive ion channel protein [Salix suchowensis]|nr:mechanosensitive ion channel protein [Salix suchowensis]